MEQIHDCEDETEVCRNTAGAYDCEPRACDRGYRLDPITRLCQDVDECEENGALCGAGQRCINTPGSFVCVPAAAATATAAPTAHTAHTAPATQQTTARPDPRRPRPGACPSGFRAGASPGLCDDINECQEGSHSCRQDEVCVNELGRFRCERGRPSPTTPSPSTDCPQGYQFSRLHRQCVGEKLWSAQRTRCLLYPLALTVEPSSPDVDECATGTHNCSPSERCVNEGGAFQCSPACEPGFRVRAAGRLTATVCEDIDECAEGLHSCLIASQRCRNTNGSFTCEDSPPCPSGYFRTPSGGCDGRTQII
ncbi:hypothetical protein FOCC_FOCC000773 [Frankliniella occidentalis]|nr:hypothetical protein FOCC_FOCC000773 [Frankliniella occidentalis]